MKDCFLDTLFSPGEACGDGEETLTRPYIYNTPISSACQAKKIPLGGGWCVRRGHKTTTWRVIIVIRICQKQHKKEWC